MRLDKFLVETGGIRRREAQRAIREGLVSVAGLLVRDPAYQLQPDCTVYLDGELRRLRGPRYFLLHKPLGYVCAARDDLSPTVLDLLPFAEREGLHIAGRLDKDTTGLVLLTDDGAWSHRVTSPRHRCDKRYRVTLAEAFSDEDAERLRSGLQLQGEAQMTLPAQVERLSERELLLTIQEGRYHQVKRMFGALHNRVIGLHRDRVGALLLDETQVKLGEYRALSPAEVTALG